MFILKIFSISGLIAFLIKSAIFLPILSQSDQSAIAVTAITIPVAIFGAILLSRG